ATGQFPIGTWAITLVSTADGHEEHYALDIYPNGTYQSNGVTQNWIYSPDNSTLSLTGWGAIAFHTQTANGYAGEGFLNGNQYHVTLTRR
ncbi:MAG TPA: hypothetical protein VF961_09180, partial [Pyrinomonadaceae bacterium]